MSVVKSLNETDRTGNHVSLLAFFLYWYSMETAKAKQQSIHQDYRHALSTCLSITILWAGSNFITFGGRRCHGRLTGSHVGVFDTWINCATFFDL